MRALIIHLSDIHLRKDHQNPSMPKFGFIGPALQNEEPNIDKVIVAVSGDVAFGGDDAEYKMAHSCLNTLREDLSNRFSSSEVRFVFVPGNHDCDFSVADSVRDLTIEAIRNGKTPDQRMIGCCCEPQAEFMKFRDEFFSGKPDAQGSLLHWEYRITKEPFSIGFRCFNSAWMSVINEVQGAIQIPDFVADRGGVDVTDDYVVSMFHHPYNWMPSASFRRFKSLVEDSSDLILTGHEHEADHVQKYSFRNHEVNDYLEGSVFQEGDQDTRSGFHAVFIDLAVQRQRTVTYYWQDGHFAPDESGAKNEWVAYKRGSRDGKREFLLDEDFAKWLEDPGANYQHPAKPDLCLSDIYVLPNLKQFEIGKKSDFIYGSLIEGRDVLKTLGGKNRVLLFGRQQAGKTTLAKVLFSDLYNKNLTPVFVTGEQIAKSLLKVDQLDALVESQVTKQYRNPNLPAFKQLDKDKCVLIIDDFDHASLNSAGRLKFLEVATQRYGKLIVLADDVIKLEELAVQREGGDVLADFDQFEIVQFGYLLESKLITKWFSIGSEYDSDPMELARRIHSAEQMVSTMLGKNYLPHYPVFILSLIQASQIAAHTNTSAGTYGSLYEVIITQTLASKGSKVVLETKMAYLAEIAHWMHDQRKKRISDEEWEYFHQIYCAKFKIRPPRETLKRDLASNGLFDVRDECYGFRHSAAYYYFVARYFRDNLSKEPERRAVENLLDKLYKEEHASIWLFLTHLSKDPFLLETILKHSKKIYAELTPARFEGDVLFLKALSDHVEKIVLKDSSVGEAKEARLRALDEAPRLPEPTEDFDSAEEETNEALKMLAKMNLALRTLEVLGQLVKNFPGSLHGRDKLDLVTECYALGLRTMSMLFDLFKRDTEGFIDFVYGRLIERHPDIQDRNELRTKVRRFMFWMIENASFGMIKRISHAVGHSQLGEIYREVRQQDESNAIALVDIAIRLENLGFPEDRLIDLAAKFHKNIFCEQVLKQLVVEHFYLFPTHESTKQKVCEALNIEIKHIRQMELRAGQERRAPRSLLQN